VTIFLSDTTVCIAIFFIHTSIASCRICVDTH
jgi:hypothetical protein